MAPLEDMQSRDLAWISDFVMQQMVIMLRPMMDHLQETDAACDYAQQMVQRISMDVSEVRGDLERTNKYLAILRQGLGVQNEGRCMLQRGVESGARAVKRLDEQMEGLASTLEVQGDKGRHEDLAKQVSASAGALEELQAKVELLTGETLSVKDGLLSNEARLEVSQRELRELRRGQLSMVPKLEDKAVRPPPSSQSGRSAVDPAPWPQKKTFSASVDTIGAGVGAAPPGFAGVSPLGESGGTRSGSRQEAKRVVSRVSSGTGAGARLQQDPMDFNAVPPRSASRTALREQRDSDDVGASSVGISGLGAGGLNASGSVDESSATASRLPMLSSTRQIGASRPSERGASDSGHRLRFSATMSKPEPRDKPG